MRGGFGKVDDPFIHVAGTCMVGNWLSGFAGWLAAGWKTAAWVEDVGAMGVAGTLEVEELLVDLVEKSDGTFDCLLKA